MATAGIHTRDECSKAWYKCQPRWAYISKPILLNSEVAFYHHFSWYRRGSRKMVPWKRSNDLNCSRIFGFNKVLESGRFCHFKDLLVFMKTSFLCKSWHFEKGLPNCWQKVHLLEYWGNGGDQRAKTGNVKSSQAYLSIAAWEAFVKLYQTASEWLMITQQRCWKRPNSIDTIRWLTPTHCSCIDWVSIQQSDHSVIEWVEKLWWYSRNTPILPWC